MCVRESVSVRVCVCQIVWSSSAGAPELAALLTLEASLERLVPLVDYLAAWILLPNVSQWVLHTVERGYRIQFGSPLPRFNGVVPTLVDPGQALEMGREVDTLLRKEAIEVVPPHEIKSGFFSRYFIAPKKDGGLRRILDLSQQTEVQDAHTQTGRVLDQVRGLVCHDRSGRRILPCLHPSHSQGVSEVCFQW